MYTLAYEHAHTHTHDNIFIYIYICMYVCNYVYIYIYDYKCTYVYARHPMIRRWVRGVRGTRMVQLKLLQIGLGFRVWGLGSLAVLLYYTICHVVSSIVNSCILRH